MSSCTQPTSTASLHRVIIIVEADVPRTERVPPNELLIPGRSLVLGVPRQHALDAHADALDVLDGTPSLIAEKIQTDDAVRVDVRVDRDRPIRRSNKRDLRSFYLGVGQPDFFFSLSLFILPNEKAKAPMG